MRANSNKIVRKANRHLILNTIRTYEPMTIEEVIEKTRLSHPTVLNLIKELQDEDLIHKTGYGESTGGRQPALLSLNAGSYYSIGVDMEFPPVRVAVSDLKGNIILSKTAEYDVGSSCSEVVGHLAENLEQIIIESGIQKNKVIGIGIGLPGIIDINRNISLNIERIVGWDSIPVKNIIEDRVGLPVYIRNDVHLAGLVEKNLIDDPNINNFIYIGIREGIGMAVFINGALYEGNVGNAGFLGHMTVKLDGALCSCGAKGCLETFSSKKAIIDNYIRIRKVKHSKRKPITVEYIIEQASEDDNAATEALSIAAYHLGVGISNVIKLFDIPYIVIGGLPNIRDELFLSHIRSAVKDNIGNYSSNDITITAGKLREEAYALGGCYFVIDRYFEEPKLKLFS